MSADYQANPLLTHENDESDIDIKPSGSRTMRKQRPRSGCYRALHFLSRRYLWLLSVSCIISLIVFSTTFYLSSRHLFALYDNYQSPELSEPLVKQGTTTIETLHSEVREREGLSIYDQNIKYNDFNYLDSDSLTYESRTYANNVPILFRLPKKVITSALLLIFHGCSRSAHDWFHTIERQRVVGGAIDLGYGCLAFQATDTAQQCWSSNTDINSNEDVQMVFKGLENFYKEYPKLKSLPRFTLGSSSGGMFSSLLVTNQRYKIQGQILFISFVLPEVLTTYVKAETYPPTAWIYMVADTEFASEDRINKSMQIFAQQKIPYKSFSIEPISVNSRTFHNRIPTITEDTSRYIFNRLQQSQWLDANSYLAFNPRRQNSWKRYLFAPMNKTIEVEKILKNLKKHENVLPEFFNTIYGEHEISFEHTYEALKWHKCIYNNKTDVTM